MRETVSAERHVSVDDRSDRDNDGELPGDGRARTAALDDTRSRHSSVQRRQ